MLEILVIPLRVCNQAQHTTIQAIQLWINQGYSRHIQCLCTQVRGVLGCHQNVWSDHDKLDSTSTNQSNVSKRANMLLFETNNLNDNFSVQLLKKSPSLILPKPKPNLAQRITIPWHLCWFTLSQPYHYSATVSATVSTTKALWLVLHGFGNASSKWLDVPTKQTICYACV